MRRPTKAAGKLAKARRRNAAPRKSGNALKAPRRGSPVAGISKQVAALMRERDEALERQKAIGEILASISGSRTDAKPVFEAIVRNLLRLFGASSALVALLQDGMIHLGALGGERGFEKMAERYPLRLDDNTVPGRAMLSKHVFQLAPMIGNPDTPVSSVQFARDFGFNSLISAPMLRGDKVIGAIIAARGESKPFHAKQIELIRSFAAQAVIAIENTRLLTELRQRTDDLTESLEQQTATAKVLEVISRSAFDLKVVFETVVESSARLCAADRALIHRFDGEVLRVAAAFNASDELEEWMKQNPIPLVRHSGAGRAALERRTIHVPDFMADPEFTLAAKYIETVRTIVWVPILKGDDLLGVLTLYHLQVRPFTDKQIALVETFADQAAIAIENVRLFEAEQQRTRELSESLEQQTATSEVLQVISSSPGDLKPVFATMLANAARICEASFGSLAIREGNAFRRVALHNAPPEFVEFNERSPLFDVSVFPTLTQIMTSKQAVHITDLQVEGPDNPLVKYAGARTLLVVPLLKADDITGIFGIYRREVRPFTDKQIELARNFAAQAVIAIENTRLLSELRESLEQQTATADVLRVISSSPGDLKPVFDAVLANAVRICDARFGNLALFDGKDMRMAAMHNAPPAFDELRSGDPVIPLERSILGPLVRTKKVVHVGDHATEEPFAGSMLAKLAGARSALAVPMLREGELVGSIAVYHQEVRPFTDKQIALLTNFAAQAVIAIENTRLLSELRQSLEQQTATAEVLGVINASRGDLQPVFEAMVEKARRLCEADSGHLALPVGDDYRSVAVSAMSLEMEVLIRSVSYAPGRGTAVGRALAERRPVQISDIGTDNEHVARNAADKGFIRTILGVPLLRESEAIGAFGLSRQRVEPFSERQIELVRTFADQAVIAIENVRLFEAEQQRTRELVKSLEELRTAQDRLVQTEKLASLGQLTAGIAHEIKNPLNFVNNFSSVSVELIDELRQSLSGAQLDDKLRAEINEIADTLQSNLDKIVQHGKRADAIVKNMLLHSRQGSGEHRPVDINTLVEDSLNLAYHGARAEKQGFNITLERSFDPAAGEVDLFPQEITRVLLNLISNGFYAATKRNTEVNGGDYEPTLAAATKTLGNSVEIRIRDNGTGIPPEVKKKMFNPFFTTKPAGEGTGLGLSISHDIIVKQHGGSIEVDTKPGEFTEFRIVLPRTGASSIKSGEHA
jgi:GAF domain-containing protein